MSSSGRQYGVGFELGRIVVTNMRVAVGYNVFGFKFSEELFRRQQ